MDKPGAKQALAYFGRQTSISRAFVNLIGSVGVIFPVGRIECERGEDDFGRPDTRIYGADGNKCPYPNQVLGRADGRPVSRSHQCGLTHLMLAKFQSIELNPSRR